MRPQVGVVLVSSPTVYEFRVPAVRSVAASADSVFAQRSVVSICDSPAFSAAGESERADSNPDGLDCARGLRSAFLLEAGMFMLAYGVWHLWHLAR